MEHRPTPRALYEAIGQYSGGNVFNEVVGGWMAADRGRIAEEIRPLWHFGEVPRGDPRALLPILYGLSRVSDALLIAWNPPAVGQVPGPAPLAMWGADHAWPSLRLEEYVALFASLGMRPVRPRGFDPVLCEIVSVHQVSEPDAPVEIVDVRWPALMLGELVFQRAGVDISAGRGNEAAGVADRSPLYWCYLRRHRKTDDLSMGWGHNSQWDMLFRRDYITAGSVYLNVDKSRPAEDEPEPDDDSLARLLTPAQRRDLLVNRCMTCDPLPDQPVELVTTEELWVYDWTASWQAEVKYTDW